MKQKNYRCRLEAKNIYETNTFLGIKKEYEKSIIDEFNSIES